MLDHKQNSTLLRLVYDTRLLESQTLELSAKLSSIQRRTKIEQKCAKASES